MSELDALFRLLNAAPPRAAGVLRRVALEQVPLPRLAALYGLGEAEAKVLVFRAAVEALTGAPPLVPDEREGREVAALWGGPAEGAREGVEAKALLERLTRNAAALEERLAQAQADFEASPDRLRDERVRYALIALVLALTAFFYWQEQHRPPPPPHRRPVLAPPVPAP